MKLQKKIKDRNRRFDNARKELRQGSKELRNKKSRFKIDKKIDNRPFRRIT